MQTFKVNRSSWHFRLVAQYNISEVPKDFCSYWRYVVFAVLFKIAYFAMLAALASAILFGIGSWLYLLYLDPVSGFISLGVLATALTIPLVITAIANYIRKRKPSENNKQPSIFAAKYHSWKHKYCPAIEYENDNN